MNPTSVPNCVAVLRSSGVVVSALALSLASPAPAAPASVRPVPNAAAPAPDTGNAAIPATGAARPTIDPNA